MRVPRWLWISLALGAGASVLAGGAAITLWSTRPEHLRAPEPRGMVLRIELPEAKGPWGNASIRRSTTAPTRLVVIEFVKTHVTSNEFASYEIEYPSGARATQPVSVTTNDDPSVDASFDFDGDGTLDEMHCTLNAGTHRVLVSSGATGKELFVHEDPREYEYETGAFPLGDLDGDGCAELALLHPRIDRSYDMEPYDAVLGARSWITVVSGKLACAP